MDKCIQRRSIWLGLVSMLLLVGCAGSRSGTVACATAAYPPGTGFVRCEMTFDGKPQPLWVFVPRHYSPTRKFPAIVFLHGLFEAGTEDGACLKAGLGPVIAQRPDAWPFVTIFPQSTGTWRGPERDRLVIESLDFAQQKYSIDPDRVILAGLSYGALGTWQIGANHPDRFAALVPVSGHRATDLVERLVLLPVWAFDMRDDPIVSAQSSQDMCREIQKRGGIARLTEFLGNQHDCWPQAVNESNLIVWMLEQRRSATSATVIVATDPAQ
jgi:predicted peptidase